MSLSHMVTHSLTLTRKRGIISSCKHENMK
jgi:hypothetical protein